MPPPYDAVVLAGGQARRLGGQDKPGLPFHGRPLVARVVDAVADAARVVLVGPPRPGVPADVTTREQPPGSGPVAAVEAGLAHVGAEHVAVLAGDLPFLTSDAVHALRERLADVPSADAVLAVDEGGRDQLLLAVWRTSALAARLEALQPVAGLPVRRLVAGANVGRCLLLTPAGRPPAWFDMDTPADVDEARGWA